MATPTYIPIATTTLASSASSVTFGSIPATYRDLRIIFNGKISGDFDTPIRINSDSAGNYYTVYMSGNGSSATSGFNNAITGFNLGLRNVTIASTDNTVSLVDFFDYSATDKHKTILKRVNSASKQTYAEAVRWASTAAITTITMSVSGGTFATGSTFSLYGIH